MLNLQSLIHSIAYWYIIRQMIINTFFKNRCACLVSSTRSQKTYSPGKLSLKWDENASKMAK